MLVFRSSKNSFKTFQNYWWMSRQQQEKGCAHIDHCIYFKKKAWSSWLFYKFHFQFFPSSSPWFFAQYFEEFQKLASIFRGYYMRKYILLCQDEKCPIYPFIVRLHGVFLSAIKFENWHIKAFVRYFYQFFFTKW